MGAEQSVPQVELNPSDSTKHPDSSKSTASPSALVICGPSGVGKGTLIQILLEESNQFAFSVSHTTRPPRPEEKNGVHYHFVEKAEFERGIESGLFLEYAKVHEQYYGTSRDAVEAVLQTGVSCILDIDIQGARQVRRSGLKAVFVFIAPPSEEELERRLRGRGTDSEEQISIRLNRATAEMESMSEPGLFDFCVVNEDLSQAYAELRGIAMQAKDGILPKAAENGSHQVVEKVDLPLVGNLDQWKGKVALITDACSSVGKAISRAMAATGLRIIALGKNRESLEKLQHLVLDTGILTQNLLPIVCDTSKEGEVSTLRKIVEKRWPDGPSVDILINISCGFQENAGLLEGSATAWVEMLSSNVLAACLCSREVISSTKTRQEAGYVFNIAVIPDDAPQSAIGMLKATNQAIQSISDDLRKEAERIGSKTKVICVKGDEPATVVSVNEIARAVVWVLNTPSGLYPQNISIGNNTTN